MSIKQDKPDKPEKPEKPEKTPKDTKKKVVKIVTHQVKIKNEVIQLDKGNLPKKMTARIPLSEVTGDSIYTTTGIAVLVILRDLGINVLDVSIYKKDNFIEIVVEK